MTLQYKIEVVQGEIEVNSVYPLALGEDFAMFSIDCNQKYPEFVSASERGLMLGAGEQTLFLDRAKVGHATVVEILLPESECKDKLWHFTFEMCRYGAILSFIRWSLKDRERLCNENPVYEAP